MLSEIKQVKEIKTYKWDNVPCHGNKYLTKIEPLMLTEKGVIIEQQLRLVGQHHKEWVKVIYDREYVCAKLAVSFIQALSITSFKKFIDIVLDAWNYVYKDFDSSQYKIDFVNRCDIDDNSDISNCAIYPAINIDLSELKIRKLHGSKACFINELKTVLNKQGILITNNGNESNADNEQ